MVIEIENGKCAFYGIIHMHRPALESVEKEAKILLRAEIIEYEKMGFHFHSDSAGSGEIDNSLVCAANQKGQSE